MLALGARGRGFDSPISPFAFVAQWTARMTSNHKVVGSSPTGGFVLKILSYLINHCSSGAMDSAYDFESWGCGFESHLEYNLKYRGYSSVGEQSTADRWVPGSNPGIPSSTISSVG